MYTSSDIIVFDGLGPGGSEAAAPNLRHAYKHQHQTYNFSLYLGYVLVMPIKSYPSCTFHLTSQLLDRLLKI